MGNVALNAGIYLLAKLNMTLIAELTANELFDVEHVEVKDGILQLGRRPRHRFFVWIDPAKQHDLVVFLGEAQPPVGKYTFCRQLIDYARQLGVSRIYTFAAMATQMRPEHSSRVFVAATNAASLAELSNQELGILEDGHIGGLNGILLGVAREFGLHGACLLGEMPQVFSQLTFPKASLEILKVFTALAKIDVDFSELSELAEASEKQLGDILAQIEQAYDRQETMEAETYQPEPSEEVQLDAADRRHIEQLFDQSAKDRSKAFELKQELDRLGMFKEYEDRFLDLFKKSE
jgi:proteasome assembly chaperone (PAC2) family protein